MERMKRNRTCTVEGCDRKHSAKGYCAAHYQRWQNTGDALTGGPLRTVKSARERMAEALATIGDKPGRYSLQLGTFDVSRYSVVVVCHRQQASLGGCPWRTISTSVKGALMETVEHYEAEHTNKS